MDAKLYYSLQRVREKLKIKYYSNGRMPTICTDEALSEMARLMPRNSCDLEAVKGLGKVFIEKYGDFFLAEINRFLNAGKKIVPLRPEVKKTLKRLEDRLVNISRRNRLLYMAKIYSRYAFDLYFEGNERYNQSILKFIFGEEKILKISEPGFNRDYKIINERRFKNATTLIREARLWKRETGEDDLFVAYPFVCGKTAAEEFDVRAPLLLFPVEITSNNMDAIAIKMDKTRDILYNTNLVLLQNKISGTRSEAEAVYDETLNADFFDGLYNYYSEFGIKIERKLPEFSKFNEYMLKDFPKFEKGRFVFENCAVLGKFSMYSSAMQRDYKTLGEREDINAMLDQLLSGIGEAEAFAADDDYIPIESANSKGFIEKEVNYINELNASQENALIKIRDCDTLVIHGPPGTGKSQVITSFISDFATRGKNVLMASQKKTALDVIYSRLSKHSVYTVFLSDVKNKEEFYRQLNNLFFSDGRNKYDPYKFNYLSDEIDGSLKRLKQVADKMYEDIVLGVPVYKIYQENIDNLYRGKIPDEETLLMLKTIEGAELQKISYNRVFEIYNCFKDTVKLQSAVLHHKLITEYPWLEYLKDGVTKLDKARMLSEFAPFIESQTKYLKSNFFERLFKKGKQNNQLKEIAQKYFSKFDLMFKNPEKISDSISNIEQFIETRSVYQSLKEDEKRYVSAAGKISFKDANKRVYDFIIYMTIEKFEASNRALLDSIKNYQYITEKAAGDIALKAQVTKEKLHRALSDAYMEFIDASKRYGEMKRIIEGKRKWPINKFVDKFSLELLKGVKVWLLTPEVISEILPLENDLFDLLIFDEASQIYIEKGVPAVSRAKKVIVAGDSKQLRPSSLGFGRSENLDEEEIDYEHSNAALEVESLLDLAKTQFADNEVLLNYHYRSRYEELIAFSNAAFYNGRLVVSPNIEIPKTPPIEVVKVENGHWIERTNKEEAAEVVKLIRNHFETRKSGETIGVITFNSNQRDMILDYLDAEYKKDQKFAAICAKEIDRKEKGEDVGLFIKNIENVQGDERDVIIFSFAYAKDEKGKVIRNFGWLNQAGGENRLNVAISRAKKKIIIVTSINPEELVVDDLKNEGPKFFRKYLEYTKAVSLRDVKSAERILSSMCEKAEREKESVLDFEKEIKGRLSQILPAGYEIECNVGMGNYKIDMAVKEKASGKYVLGIDIDGKLYERFKSERDRDIHRNSYLTSRGWQIYRIYSSNWWRDSAGELEKIKGYLG